MFTYFLLCGFNREANIGTTVNSPTPNPLTLVRYRFHNIRGMSDSAFRSLYLKEQRKYCDVLLCAETNCPTPLDERSWGQDWPRGSFTAWSSASPYTNCRGMAIFVSDSVDFKNPRVIVGRRPGYPDDPDMVPDPTGRIIAVHATVSGRTTNIIGFHADNSNDPARHISADESQVRPLLRLKEVTASMPDNGSSPLFF